MSLRKWTENLVELSESELLEDLVHEMFNELPQERQKEINECYLDIYIETTKNTLSIEDMVIRVTTWKMAPDGESGHGDSDTINLETNEDLAEVIKRFINPEYFGHKPQELEFTATDKSIKEWMQNAWEECGNGNFDNYKSMYVGKIPTEWGYYEFELEAIDPFDELLQ